MSPQSLTFTLRRAGNKYQYLINGEPTHLFLNVLPDNDHCNDAAICPRPNTSLNPRTNQYTLLKQENTYTGAETSLFLLISGMEILDFDQDTHSIEIEGLSRLNEDICLGVIAEIYDPEINPIIQHMSILFAPVAHKAQLGPHTQNVKITIEREWFLAALARYMSSCHVSDPQDLPLLSRYVACHNDVYAGDIFVKAMVRTLVTDYFLTWDTMDPDVSREVERKDKQSEKMDDTVSEALNGDLGAFWRDVVQVRIKRVTKLNGKRPIT